MKLVLKRVQRQVEATSLHDEARRFLPTKTRAASPFALHTEDGRILPCQASTTLHSEHGDVVRLTVVFTVDGDSLAVEGDVV